MSAKIRGVDKIAAQLTKLQTELNKALAQTGRKAFKPVLEAAKAKVPRDTGELADSLKIAVEKPTSENGALRVGIKVGVGRGTRQAKIAAAAFGEGQTKNKPAARRWHFEELGTSKQPARPFLRPALEENADRVVEVVKAELATTIKKVTK